MAHFTMIGLDSETTVGPGPMVDYTTLKLLLILDREELVEVVQIKVLPAICH